MSQHHGSPIQLLGRITAHCLEENIHPAIPIDRILNFAIQGLIAPAALIDDGHPCRVLPLSFDMHCPGFERKYFRVGYGEDCTWIMQRYSLPAGALLVSGEVKLEQVSGKERYRVVYLTQTGDCGFVDAELMSQV